MRKILSSLTVDDIHPHAINKEKLNELLDLLRKYKLKSTIFVIPFRRGQKLSIDKEYVKIIKNYLDEGNEIGLHGYQHYRYEFGYSSIFSFPFPSFQSQLRKLEKGIKYLEDIFNIEISGFRAPDYEFNNGTIKALHRLKFKYDSSTSLFKPTHIPNHGFRFRTFVPPHPHIVNGGLIEIPITGDYNESLDFKKLDEDIEYVYKRNGCFIDNNHIQQIAINEKFVKALVNNNKLKFCTMNEIIEKRNIY
jgi:peptidoglycan/xylan/chitin deacetylase (PgdA/CDA1 family)